MADPRFFTNRGPFALAELARICGAELHSSAIPDKPIDDVAALDTGGENDIGFLDNKKYVDAFKQSQIGACIVRPDRLADAPSGMNVLLTNKPYRCFALVRT